MLLTCHCQSCRTEVHPDEALDYEFTNDNKVRITVPCEKCGGQMVSGFAPDKTFCADVMGGGRQFESTHWSEAMAISPSQIDAHKKLWPDIPVRPDGVVGFNSVQQQENYMKDTGFVKHPQKLRPVATR